MEWQGGLEKSQSDEKDRVECVQFAAGQDHITCTPNPWKGTSPSHVQVSSVGAPDPRRSVTGQLTRLTNFVAPPFHFTAACGRMRSESGRKCFILELFLTHRGVDRWYLTCYITTGEWDGYKGRAQREGGRERRTNGYASQPEGILAD